MKTQNVPNLRNLTGSLLYKFSGPFETVTRSRRLSPEAWVEFRALPTVKVNAKHGVLDSDLFPEKDEDGNPAPYGYGRPEFQWYRLESSDGREYLVDNQGYSYPRYILEVLPPDPDLVAPDPVRLLRRAYFALNLIPNQKGVGPLGESSYEIARAIKNYFDGEKTKAEPTSY